MEERKRVTGRSWLITIQGPKNSGNEWKAKIPVKWENSYQYRCGAYEWGNNAMSMHYHLLIYFKRYRVSAMLAKDVIRCNPHCEVDIEEKMGTWEQAINYVKIQDETAVIGRAIEEWGRGRKMIKGHIKASP